tara:strand:- start:234 stop:671 length:438 start_codon:yes stop_codon:yes gene_type:complete
MNKNIFLSGSFVIIDINGKLLFQKRDNKSDIWYPNLLGLFGGSIENKETPIICALRELNEETNFNFKSLDLLFKINFSTAQKFKYIFYKKINSLPKKFKVNEGSGYKCIRYENIYKYKKEIISIDFYAVTMYLYFIKNKSYKKAT